MKVLGCTKIFLGYAELSPDGRQGMVEKWLTSFFRRTRLRMSPSQLGSGFVSLL